MNDLSNFNLLGLLNTPGMTVKKNGKLMTTIGAKKDENTIYDPIGECKTHRADGRPIKIGEEKTIVLDGDTSGAPGYDITFVTPSGYNRTIRFSRKTAEIFLSSEGGPLLIEMKNFLKELLHSEDTQPYMKGL